MDFAKCVQILSNRSHTHQQHQDNCPCCSAPKTAPVSGSLNIAPPAADSAAQPLVDYFQNQWDELVDQLPNNKNNDTDYLCAQEALQLIVWVLAIQQARIKVVCCRRLRVYSVLPLSYVDLPVL
jgi:hypothetical protein